MRRSSAFAVSCSVAMNCDTAIISTSARAANVPRFLPALSRFSATFCAYTEFISARCRSIFCSARCESRAASVACLSALRRTWPFCAMPFIFATLREPTRKTFSCTSLRISSAVGPT